MIVDATEDQARAALGAMLAVAGAQGTEPLSAADQRGIAAAWHTVFGRDGDVEPDELEVVPPAEAAGRLPANASGLRLTVVRLLAVMALVDADIDDRKLALVGEFAAALDVHADFVDAMAALLRNDIAWAAFDEIRHNVETIPGVPWEPDHPYAPFLPYTDAPRPDVADRYRALEAKPAGTMGRAFFEHYTSNGYEFPGERNAVAEAWGTPHDSLHILSGYSTSAQGELLVAAFTAAAKRGNRDMMESHVIPTILIYHMGIDINKGLNAGDRERMAADPSWRDNYDGNVHLGLDAAKLWAAWERGAAMTEDVYSGHWHLWDHVDTPVADLRATYGIEPIRPEEAALPDGAILRADYERPGLPPPPAVSHLEAHDRPG